MMIKNDKIDGKNYSTTRFLTREQPEIKNKLDEKFETMLFLPKVDMRKGEGGLRTKGFFKKSFSNKPLVTIITVVFNSEKYLEETILSVINQTYDNIEYIVIDGESTDGTTEIIQKYDGVIDYWVSESDGGIYNAMNKAMVLATSDYIFHLNAGDIAIELLSFEVINCLLNDFDMVIGNVIYDDGRIFNNRSFRGIVLKNTIHHQGCWYKLDKIKKVGKYNTLYQILADYDLNLRLKDINIKYSYVDKNFANCLSHGISDIPRFKNYLEEIKIRNTHYPWYVAVPFNVLTMLRFLAKKILKI
jgi:glycosyltransferase involved in cell wall biosynthesis